MGVFVILGRDLRYQFERPCFVFCERGWLVCFYVALVIVIFMDGCYEIGIDGHRVVGGLVIGLVRCS